MDTTTTSQQGRRLRVPVSAQTQNYEKVGEKFTVEAKLSELREDTYLNKWAMFDNRTVVIGKIQKRRDVIQTMKEPSGMLAKLGVVNGDMVDVIIDQEYWLLTNVNENTGVWLSDRRFNIGDAIMRYARMLNPWSEHVAIRAKVPNI